MAGEAATRWADQLAAWAIPDEIRQQAPADPWTLPVALFRPGPDEPPDTVSRRRAREALPDGGTVLDVGCGGGRASLALAPPAARVVGVDRSPGMLAVLADAAEARGLSHTEITGDWPDVAPQSPVADVAVCHHVVYNAPDLAGFATALSDRARHRVVVELTESHPLTWLNPLWRQFWDLDRPAGPTATDAAAVLADAGVPARLERFETGLPHRLASLDPADRVAVVRTQLCLPADRDDEVAAALDGLGAGGPRRLATIWWDRA